MTLIRIDRVLAEITKCCAGNIWAYDPADCCNYYEDCRQHWAEAIARHSVPDDLGEWRARALEFARALVRNCALCTAEIDCEKCPTKEPMEKAHLLMLSENEAGE